MASTSNFLRLVFFLILLPILAVGSRTCHMYDVFSENNTEYIHFKDIKASVISFSAGYLSHIFMSLAAVALLVYATSQLLETRHVESEMNIMAEKYERTKDKVSGVCDFYRDTEKMFVQHTVQSYAIQQKFRENGEDKVNGAIILDDIESLKRSWVRQQEIFNSYGIELEGRQLSTESIKAELTVALGFVGKEIRKVEKDMVEDLLTFEEVQSDTNVLKIYFKNRK